jgi:hypothetical protein
MAAALPSGTTGAAGTNLSPTNMLVAGSRGAGGAVSAWNTNRVAAAELVAASVVLTVEGKAEWSKFGTKAWSLVQTNQLLFPGDRLRTGLKSRATIRLANLSILRVNELTTLEIQPPSAGTNRPALKLEEGSGYFFNRDPITPAPSLQIRTPNAEANIRG